jgi:hypothetical protein
MLVAAMEALKTRTRLLLLALLAATLSSCSSDSDNPVTPPVDAGESPVVMARVIGTPRVKIVFLGDLTESQGAPALRGAFSVVVYDSTGRSTFLVDLRLEGVPMHAATDGTTRYLLDLAEIPGFQVGDSLHFDVVDGGTLTPPFSYLILPSHLTLPADSAVVHQSQDLVLPWNGAVERVLVTISDIQSKSIRYNYQVSNFTGATKLTIPARDLAGLKAGPLFVGTDVHDTENIGASGQTQQQLDLETRQSRSWQLAP